MQTVAMISTYFSSSILNTKLMLKCKKIKLNTVLSFPVYINLKGKFGTVT